MILARELHFSATLQSADHGLRYLGPTLRGAFGRILKRSVCQVSHGQCPKCLLRNVCPYPRVFDGRPPVGRRIMTRYHSVPQPFVLLVARPGEWWGPQDELRWGIRLFGSACDYWPYVVQVFRDLGEVGVGRRRIRYGLNAVADGRTGEEIWAGDCAEINEPQAFRCGDQDGKHFDGAVRWRFETPLHLRCKNRMVEEPAGLDLVLAGRRRLAILREFYGERHDDVGTAAARNEPHLDSHQFQTVEADLRPWSISRYSGRQKRRVPLQGIMGEMVIRGPWDMAGEWLGMVKTIHLGKHATFGFGRIMWEPARA